MGEVAKDPDSDLDRLSLRLGPVLLGAKRTVYFSSLDVDAAAVVVGVAAVAAVVVGGDVQACAMVGCGPTPILQTRISFGYVQLTPYAIGEVRLSDVGVPGLSEIPLTFLQLESPEFANSHKNWYRGSTAS